MEYRIDKTGLLDRLGIWNGFLKRKVHLIACGGTALTLLDVKPSTKDIDLLVPVTEECRYLIKTLKDLGYKSASGAGWARDDGFMFDLFPGKRVHTTELLESPLDIGNNIPVKELTYIYLGVLNYYDIIISKLFRGTGVDMEDCLMLMRAKAKEIDIGMLTERFNETASYDVSEDRVLKNLEYFKKLINKEKFTP
ncbi:MAG: hypothetical protein PHV48_07950 [Candidatus Omnitrophica bacterium]|nr:hypothetical protein [Candidatus Omnitrophota bacterium]